MLKTVATLLKKDCASPTFFGCLTPRMETEEQHITKSSSQYRNTGVIKRKLSFGRRVKTQTRASVVTKESMLYKRSGWKYDSHMFSIRDGDLCYRDGGVGFINCGRVISSVSTKERLLEFNIYTTQREYRMRAPDSATFKLWLEMCHIYE